MFRLISAALLSLGVCSLALAQSWEPVGTATERSRCILAAPAGGTLISVTVTGAVLKSEDRGETWRMVYTVEAPRDDDPCAAAAGSDGTVYLSSGRSVYLSRDSGVQWMRIARLGSVCRALAGTPYGLFCATDRGVYRSPDDRSFAVETGMRPARCSSMAYCASRSMLYVSREDGIYGKRLPGGAWEKLYACLENKDAQGTENSGEDAEEPRQDQEPAADAVNAVFCIDDAVFGLLCRGFVKSRDCGRSWESGLTGSPEPLTRAVAANGNAVAAGRNTVFLYDENGWRDVSAGWIEKEAYSLGWDGQSVYAACRGGLLRLRLANGAAAVNPEPLPQDAGPGIADVQRAAINYAEVSNEKIAGWRRSAARSAWLPRVSLGFNRDTGDLWHWESGSTAKECDDYLRRGKDSLEWDVSLSWELGNLVWNDAQTSIDTRSRLLVELREDILDAVNKLYFERLRLMSGFFRTGQRDDTPAHRELRIRELEAGLDALTGGYYSRALGRR